MQVGTKACEAPTRVQLTELRGNGNQRYQFRVSSQDVSLCRATAKVQPLFHRVTTDFNVTAIGYPLPRSEQDWLQDVIMNGQLIGETERGDPTFTHGIYQVGDSFDPAQLFPCGRQ